LTHTPAPRVISSQNRMRMTQSPGRALAVYRSHHSLQARIEPGPRDVTVRRLCYIPSP